MFNILNQIDAILISTFFIDVIDYEVFSILNVIIKHFDLRKKVVLFYINEVETENFLSQFIIFLSMICKRF